MKKVTVLVFACGLAIASTASADIARIIPSQDNTLYIHPTGDLSSGAGNSMFIGVNRRTAADGTRRALSLFDVAAAIPAGSTINSVNLRVFVSRTRGSNINVQMHRVLGSWGESFSNGGDSSGGGGDVARPGDATWIHRFADNDNPVLWNTPGGDFAPTISGSRIFSSQLGSFTFESTPGLVADVQRWLDRPSENFGWLFKTPEQFTGNVLRVSTREAVESERPVLEIDYTIPAPGSAALAIASIAMIARRRR